MYLIGNGRLLTRDPRRDDIMIEDGAVCVSGSRIVGIGATGDMRAQCPEAEFIDAEGGIIMPGLINAHTHSYSYLLRGFAMPGYSPSCFYEALSGKAWKLDANLTFRDCAAAAYAAMMSSIKCGVTTVFDHFASSDDPSGTLLCLAGAAEEAGLNAALCCETSERCGYNKCCREIEENLSFIDYCESCPSERVKALFGLHALFTLGELDLGHCAEKLRGRTGFHIHVSESPDDRYVSLHNYKCSPVERLLNNGILGEKTILAHCVDTRPGELDIISRTRTNVVINPQSNMSNGVGFAPVKDMLDRRINVGLGTDAFTSDMLESARALICYLRQGSGLPSYGVKETAKILFENNRLIASRYFGGDIGVLREGARADIAVFDHKPFTRFSAENADPQILFGLNGSDCRMTMASGRVLMRDRKLLSLDEPRLCEMISACAEALWKRLERSEDKDYPWRPGFISMN